jgi:uncharacterized coiled-coil DUF342 family protein
MSQCARWRQKMLDTQAEISRLENDLQTSVRISLEEGRDIERKIEVLRQEAASWKKKWERSLKRGGC